MGYKREKFGQIYFPDNVYEDLIGDPLTGVQNSATKPDIRQWAFGIGSGVTFPVAGFDIGDYVFLNYQTRHAMKLSSILDNHIHFSTPSNDVGKKFKFQVDVIAAPIGGQFAVPTGSPFTAEYTMLAADLGYHRFLELADIPAVNTTVSTLYYIKISRINASSNEYGSEVYVLANDSHYRMDDMGSTSETTKI